MEIGQVMKRTLEDWAEELNGDMKVDKFRLDEECARQTSVYTKWAFLTAEAGRERDWRQKELDEMNARLDNEVRVYPEKFGLKEIKENAVKAVIAGDEGIMKLKADLINATAYYKFFSSAVAACDQKKTMLRMLGDLFLGEYYSNVEIKKGEGEESMRERIKARKTGGGKGRL